MSRLRRPRSPRLDRRLKRHQVSVPFFTFHPRPWWEWAILAGFWLTIALGLAFSAWSFLHQEWRIRVETLLPLPPAAVFAAVDEPARRLAWEPGVVAITPLVGDGRQAGDTRLVFFARQGQRWQEEERILKRRAPRLLVLDRSGPMRDARISIEIEPAREGQDDRTRLTWHEEVRYHAPFDRMLGWWRSHQRRERLEQAFRRIAER